MTTRIPNVAMKLEYHEIDTDAAKLLVAPEKGKNCHRRSWRVDSGVYGGNFDHGGADGRFGQRLFRRIVVTAS